MMRTGASEMISFSAIGLLPRRYSLRLISRSRGRELIDLDLARSIRGFRQAEPGAWAHVGINANGRYIPRVEPELF